MSATPRGDRAARTRATRPARRPARSRHPGDLAWLGLGAALLVLSALPVHAHRISSPAASAFRLRQPRPEHPVRDRVGAHAAGQLPDRPRGRPHRLLLGTRTTTASHERTA